MFKYSIGIVAAALVFLIAALAACTAPTPFVTTPAPTTAAPAAGPIVVTDTLGRTVKLDKLPQRIVLTGRAFFMIADALYLFPEAAVRLVGLPDTTQSPNDFFAVLDPNYASKFIASQAGPEQIAPLKPDVVLTKSVNANRVGKPLEQLNIPVLYVDLETPEQYTRDLMTLGQLFGNSERAKMIAAYYQAQVDRVSVKTKNLKETDKPRALLLQYAEKGGTIAFSIPPVEWMQTVLVEMAGGRAVWKQNANASGWSVVNLEQIAAWNPEVVFIVYYGNDPKGAIAHIKADPKWQSLKAVKENKIYGFPGDYYTWDQPDTRWGLGLLWLATKIHPTLFSDVNIQQELTRFYALYGFDEAAIQTKVMPLLVGDLK